MQCCKTERRKANETHGAEHQYWNKNLHLIVQMPLAALWEM